MSLFALTENIFSKFWCANTLLSANQLHSVPFFMEPTFQLLLKLLLPMPGSSWHLGLAVLSLHHAPDPSIWKVWDCLRQSLQEGGFPKHRNGPMSLLQFESTVAVTSPTAKGSCGQHGEDTPTTAEIAWAAHQLLHLLSPLLYLVGYKMWTVVQHLWVCIVPLLLRNGVILCGFLKHSVPEFPHRQDQDPNCADLTGTW